MRKCAIEHIYLTARTRRKSQLPDSGSDVVIEPRTQKLLTIKTQCRRFVLVFTKVVIFQFVKIVPRRTHAHTSTPQSSSSSTISHRKLRAPHEAIAAVVGLYTSWGGRLTPAGGTYTFVQTVRTILKGTLDF